MYISKCTNLISVTERRSERVRRVRRRRSVEHDRPFARFDPFRDFVPTGKRGDRHWGHVHARLGIEGQFELATLIPEANTQTR